MTTEPTTLALPPAGTVRWTGPQRRAIEDRGRDLIVSASAGSGKTAVLTERVLRLVTEPDPVTGAPPARMDELLVLTFTEKAARQMRERIEQRLLRELAAQPDALILREAIDGLGGAWIMTIDACCRRLVIEHFHEAGTTPAPRIPDEGEQTELDMTVLGTLLDQWARGQAGERDAVRDLLRALGGAPDTLTQELRRLMAFLQSLDQPEKWLAPTRETLTRTAQAATYTDLPQAYDAAESFARATRELAEAFQTLLALARSEGADVAVLERWRPIAQELARLAALPAPFRPDAHAPWLTEQADEILGKLDKQKVCGKSLYARTDFRDTFLKGFSRHYARWRAHWFPLDEAGLERGARLAAAQGLTLLSLAEAAMERIEQAKGRRGLMTFNDFERKTQRLLADADGTPSAVARQLQQRFRYVLVDEYQDTSPLQDDIVLRLSTAVPNGNLFLVGDAKQSIYRFRHAEPALFLDKLDSEAEGARRPFHRINLHKNFRSRPALLTFINECFTRLMDHDVGDLDYTEAEKLQPGRTEPPVAEPVCVEVQWLEKTAEDPAETAEEEHAAEAETADSEQAEGAEAQAQWVARRIRELTDPEHGVMIPDEEAPADTQPAQRRARPGDCAILLRSLRSELGLWIDALEAEGLKVRAPGLNPLFTATELVDLVGALRVADNPLQDVPLAALMRSPLGGFSDGELLAIRMIHPAGPFFMAVWAAAGRPLPEDALENAAGAGPSAAQPAIYEVLAPERATDEWSPEEEAAEDINEDEDVERAPAAAPASPLDAPVRAKLSTLMERIDRWRAIGRRAPASEVLTAILDDTGYEAYLMGHLDGMARLENLDFLRGLLRRLGRCDEGANPLAAFLATVDRARAEEGDVGELPESVAAQTDAVNLLTIHRSKGLEFPIVFLPRLERRFRIRGAGSTICDREGGLARSGVDGEARLQYPTLAHRMLTESLGRKDRSEELRLLYVAMTRARERLILVAQPGKLDQLQQRWRMVRALGGAPLGALDRLYAATPADLIGPVVEWLRMGGEDGEPRPWLSVASGAPPWIRPVTDLWARARQAFQRLNAPGEGSAAEGLKPEALSTIGRQDVRTMLGELTAPGLHFVPTIDPAAALTALPAKLSVTQLQEVNPGALTAEDFERQEDRWLEEEMRRPYFTRHGSLQDRRPGWLATEDSAGQPAAIGGARRGTLTHALLAGLDLGGALDRAGLRAQAERLIEAGLIGDPNEAPDQILACLDWDGLAWFFTTALGRRMVEKASFVSREQPFTASKYIHDFLPGVQAAAFQTERIIVQGIIDAVIDEGDRALVIDYKTDYVPDEAALAARVEHYTPQLTQYKRALNAIWRLKSTSAWLVFLGARRVVEVKDPAED